MEDMWTVLSHVEGGEKMKSKEEQPSLVASMPRDPLMVQVMDSANHLEQMAQLMGQLIL